MIFFIIYVSIVSLIAIGSIYLNRVLYKECDSLTNFFTENRNRFEENFHFFYKLSKTDLMTDTPEVREMVKHLVDIREHFRLLAIKTDQIREDK